MSFLPSLRASASLRCKITPSHKKAQIKFGETIAILFIFFVLLVIGFIFYARFAAVSAGQEQIKAQELQSVQTSQAISFLSELACTEFGVVESGCFDLQKVEALAAIGTGPGASNPFARAYYLQTFGKATIIVRSIYPPGLNATIYDNPKENFTSSSNNFFPIALKNATSGKYSLGVLEVRVYG
jgi:hypothetical protein